MNVTWALMSKLNHNYSSRLFIHTHTQEKSVLHLQNISWTNETPSINYIAISIIIMNMNIEHPVHILVYLNILKVSKIRIPLKHHQYNWVSHCCQHNRGRTFNMETIHIHTPASWHPNHLHMMRWRKTNFSQHNKMATTHILHST